MKALQMKRPRSFEKVEAPVPHLASDSPNRMLIRASFVSMCGSDIAFFTGSKRHQRYPLPAGAPAHECVGQVVESTSHRFHGGDWVVAIPDGDLGLAEFFIAQDSKAIQLPDDPASRATSCLIQPLATVMNAVDRLGKLEGRSVAVVGLGSMGLLLCWLLNKRGADRIVGLDPCAHRSRLARTLGASKTYPMRSIEVVHAAREDPSMWDPPDICIEAVGHQTETLNDCIELVQRRGTVVAFGVPDQPIYAVEFETFFRKNATLVACVTPQWDEYLAMARELFFPCRDELETLLTHRLPIADAEEAFAAYERHDQGLIKVVLDCSRW